MTSRKDPKLYGHHDKMVYAVSRAPVHSKIELVALYNFDNPQVENQLLKDLTGIAQPAVQCDFQIPRDRLYPPSADTGHHGYKIFFTYNALVSPKKAQP